MRVGEASNPGPLDPFAEDFEACADVSDELDHCHFAEAWPDGPGGSERAVSEPADGIPCATMSVRETLQRHWEEWCARSGTPIHPSESARKARV